MIVPIFAPLTIEFDRDRLRDELVKSNIFAEGKIATTSTLESVNQSRWKHPTQFNDPKFARHAETNYWTKQNDIEVLSSGNTATFKQVNVTYPNNERDLDWFGNGSSITNKKYRTPVWISHHHAWNFKEYIEIPYLREIIASLELEFVSMVRIIYMSSDSIGIIHKDSAPSVNKSYFDSGGVSITLNVCSGGANLYFVDSEGKEHVVDDKYTIWHFDDSAVHCTDVTTSDRIQVRIYGKKLNYASLMSPIGAIS
jgi:hypothetical protein